jgi:hypothetical protein
MKYALKMTPGSQIDTTAWFWFQTHGCYYVNKRDGIVQEADPAFIDSNLTPEFSESVERVPFSDLPEHVHGHDARDILNKLPREYTENGEGADDA